LIIFSNGDFFTGEFKKNMFDGYGKYYYKNGDVFFGFFVKGLK